MINPDLDDLGAGAGSETGTTIRVSVAVVEDDIATREGMVREVGSGATPFN